MTKLSDLKNKICLGVMMCINETQFFIADPIKSAANTSIIAMRNLFIDKAWQA